MIKIIILFLTLSLFTSCVVADNYCSCTTKSYEVTEYKGEIIERQQVGYRQFDGNCNRDNGYYIDNIFWNGNYKHYTLTETYCY